MYNPDVIATLQAAVIIGRLRASISEYAAIVNERPVSAIRDLLALKTDREPGTAGRSGAGRRAS